MVTAQRDEIARLKGLQGHPVIKPSSMEKGMQPKPGGKRDKQRGRGKVMRRATPGTKVLRAAAVPPGPQFKGGEPYQVLDLVITARVVLRARLATAKWISVDDTGARQRGTSAVCTRIGNDSFAWFGTTGRKCRLNVLDLLRAGHTDYVINGAALDYMREHPLPGHQAPCSAAAPAPTSAARRSRPAGPHPPSRSASLKPCPPGVSPRYRSSPGRGAAWTQFRLPSSVEQPWG